MTRRSAVAPGAGTTNQRVAFRRSFVLDAAPTTAVTRIAADSKC
ncbi:hypothetical protein [Kibdelosporangium aridum]|nr:hypothetical protein [Kibdelosporangium aridum]